MFTRAFNDAVDHAMIYEVGGHWQLTDEVAEGCIETQTQRRAVGYVDDPDDMGGETKFGVSKKANPELDITALTWDEAKEVYYRKYWLAGSCDKLPPRVAVLHFDGCVNHGVHRAICFLQNAAGATVDGEFGKETLDAVNSVNEIDLCNTICSMRETFYHDIVDDKPRQAKYLRGWLRRISEMQAFTCNPGDSFV